ncbi:MAG: RIP metalloprotease RseP [Bdellovibrionota bacterium]|nr:RIP metalloprotease RseP [Bdellovibrionota bacterium]
MISGILIFFLFLGPLVFFHELGHFFFARLAGVRVETFSIGFGPKLFKWKRGDTTYAFSLIPLGGYVKMFGDDPLSTEELSDEEKKVAYTHKSKWARFWIVFGGPLANFVLAFALYFFLAMGGEKVPEPKLGVINADSQFYSVGVRTGDVLAKINGKDIFNFDDVNIADSKVNSITVNRSGETVELKSDFTTEEFQKELMGSVTQLKAPLFADKNGNVFVVQTPEGKITSLEEVRAYENETNFKLTEVDHNISGLGVWDPENRPLKYGESTEVTTKGSELLEVLKQEKGLYPVELMINNVSLGSAAGEAELKKGDLIVAVDGVDINSFVQFRDKVQSLKEEKPIELSVLNNEGLRSVTLTPKMTEHNGQQVLMVGIESGIVGYGRMVEFSADGFVESIALAYKRTVDGTANVVGMFKKLIFGEVSVNNLGGPIAIGKAANDYFNMGLSMFLRLMALISINLAVINLFPIPVLDGGHIVFIIFEIFNRGPLSRKKLMYAQQLGMSLLFLLIFVAIFNDIKRFLL